MEQELGKEKTIELAPYIGPVRLKKVEAMKILRLIWPKAPDIEIERGALLCYTYALNPLMKHVALLKFTNRKTGEETWATVLSLQAKEIIASRKHRWSYADGPRIMKKAEQEEIFGEIDQDRLWVITILQDERGNRAPGYGCFGKTETLYGEEKGNTKFNQASTRSISQALNRLFAAEMPSGVETLDETFIEGEFKEPPLESKTKKELGVAPPKKTGELPKPSDLKNLGHLYAYANEHFNLTPLQVNEILGITDKNQIADVQEAWAKILAHCQIEWN